MVDFADSDLKEGCCQLGKSLMKRCVENKAEEEATVVCVEHMIDLFSKGKLVVFDNLIAVQLSVEEVDPFFIGHKELGSADEVHRSLH